MYCALSHVETLARNLGQKVDSFLESKPPRFPTPGEAFFCGQTCCLTSSITVAHCSQQGHVFDSITAFLEETPLESVCTCVLTSGLIIRAAILDS